MPGRSWCDYTSPEDIAKDAAACLWWWEQGDREPMRDFFRRMARYAGSTASEGEPWFRFPDEGSMGDVASEVMGSLDGGDTSEALDWLSRFARGVPAGFDLHAFLRQSARENGYWGDLPDGVVEGHSGDEEEAI